MRESACCLRWLAIDLRSCLRLIVKMVVLALRRAQILLRETGFRVSGSVNVQTWPFFV